MQELFKALEVYIDERILVRTNDLEGLQIRDANRIADLERRLFGAVDMIEIQRGWINQLYHDAKGVVTDDDTDQKLEDFEYRIAELECTIEDKADANATEETIENAMSGIEDTIKDYVDTALVGADLGDIDSCEVERIVRCVLDEIEFKVTMER